MSISKLVGDIVKRSIPYTPDIEIGDFIVASPSTRPSEEPVWGVYEVNGRSKDLENFKLELQMRYIRSYDYPVDIDYDALVDESGNYIVDESGNGILMR